MKILIPRNVDARNIKAQDINVREMISRFNNSNIKYKVFYNENNDAIYKNKGNVHVEKIHFPNPSIAGQKFNYINRKIKLTFHEIEMFFRYISDHDAIFYPNERNLYLFALMINRFLKKIPIISTIEGMYGNKIHEKIFRDIIGHDIYMIPIKKRKHFYPIQKISNHVIAISPILKKYADTFYKVECSILPLGINTNIFYPKDIKKEREEITIISAGRLSRLKRPDFFIKIASKFKNVKFTWYGEGPMRSYIENIIKKYRLDNVLFPGSVDQVTLSNKMREADIFISTSLSEGWGKSIQEAQACALPVVAFGYYETPLIDNNQTGYIAWNDEEFVQIVDHLINNPKDRHNISHAAAKQAKKLSWDMVAPLWEKKILEIIGAQK